MDDAVLIHQKSRAESLSARNAQASLLLARSSSRALLRRASPECILYVPEIPPRSQIFREKTDNVRV